VSTSGALLRRANGSVFTSPVPIRFAIPLTYDEQDAANVVNLTRLGGAPWVTPAGFVGDGYASRYRVEAADIPSFATSGGQLTLHASVSASNPARSTVRDVLVSLCNDDATANPMLELCVTPDALDPEQSNIAVRTYTGSMQTKKLARNTWSYGFRFPTLVVGGQKIRPQVCLFLGADTLLIGGHYNDTLSRIYRIDLPSLSVTGQFNFASPHVHIASAAFRASDGTYWFGDYATGDLLQVDLAASFSSGTASILLTYHMSAVVGFGAIAWVNASGTDYLLAPEYDTAGTRYLYVVAASTITPGGTFAIASRLKRFGTGAIRMQGCTMHSGKLFLSVNKYTVEATTTGKIGQFDILTAIASTADGATLTPEYSWPAPSQYAEDIDFHPVTGECWAPTEGLTAVVSDDGWLAYWHRPLIAESDQSWPVNHVTVEYNGAGSIKVKVNNQLFDTWSFTPTVAPAVIAIGGPPVASAGQTNGFAICTIRNIVLQDLAMTTAQYTAAIAGSDESSVLTVYNIALTNPGAEAGSSTGWTNEVGGLVAANAAGRLQWGSYYFDAGANLQTIARQRINIAAATGLSTGAIDGAASTNSIWARVDWQQKSFSSGTDSGSMGLRMLDGAPTQISLTYGALLNTTPFYTAWLLRGLPVLIPSGARNVDAVYRSDRVSGTNNDTYVDQIAMTIYKK